jgi:hypothetical protein
MESIARSKTMPGVGRSTAMMEIALSGGASGFVRHTTHKTSAPLRSHPVADETHFFRPLMTQLSPSSFAVVRTPSPGGGEAALALPPGSLEQNPANGAPLFLKNGASSRPHWSGVPPSKIGRIPRTVPSIVRVTLAFTL